MPLKWDQSWNPPVPTLGNILTGDQFAQAALVWITLSIRSHCVYHHIHYCRGWPGHCVEVCLSGEGKGWNKWPGIEATVGQAAGLIWKDGCNYESPEELAVWQVQCVNTALTVRKVHCPPSPQQSKTLSQVNIFNLSGSIQHLSTKEDMLAATNLYKWKVKLCGHDGLLCLTFFCICEHKLKESSLTAVFNFKFRKKQASQTINRNTSHSKCMFIMLWLLH